MIAQVVTALILSQYVRSRVDDKDPASQCLWWSENTRIELHQNVDGNPENVGDSEFVAIGKAITTWQTQLNTCSSVSLVDGARTQTRKVGYFDKETNENVAVFRLKKCSDFVPQNDACKLPANDNCGSQFDCWQHQEAAIAITTTSYNPTTGRILDSDIEFNQPTFLFTTVDSPPCPGGQYSQSCIATDIQNTTTHELGHVLGLAHTSEPGSTMNPRANPGEISKRILDANTAKFVCDVYPRGLGSKTCFIKKVDPVLGEPASCSSGPGLLLAAVALWWRRRK